jgi:hypothetical protein
MTSVQMLSRSKPGGGFGRPAAGVYRDMVRQTAVRHGGIARHVDFRFELAGTLSSFGSKPRNARPTQGVWPYDARRDFLRKIRRL